jgi:hypothetical protein
LGHVIDQQGSESHEQRAEDGNGKCSTRDAAEV